MVEPAPKLDPRTAKDIEEQVRQLLAQYLPGTYDVKDPGDSTKLKNLEGVNHALVKIFARFTEILIQRLNRVPDKNFLAFLDLLGASRLPPQPARVPLTFSLAAGSAVDAIVPRGTQAAAPPAQGESDPIIFETERDLVVTAAQLTSVWVRDPEGYQWADYSAIAQASRQPEVPAFKGNHPITHSLYLGHDRWFGSASLQAVRLIVTLEADIPDSPPTNPRDPRQVQWEYWDGTQFVALPAEIVQDNTQGLTQSGTVILGNETTLTANALPEFQPTTIHGIEKRWLRGRLLTPITHRDTARQGFVRNKQLPSLTAIQIQPTIRQQGKITAAFFNTQPLDLNKNFFPFGEKPRLGDSFYLASREALTNPNATITLTVTLSQTLTLNTNPQVTWEYWNGNRWQAIASNFQDTTFAFTGVAPPVGNTRPVASLTGVVSFTAPADLAPTIVNGIEDYWLRVRLTGGSYGTDVTYMPQTITIGTTNLSIYTFTPATFTPPQIASLTLNYSILPTSSRQAALASAPNFNLPEAVVIENDNTATDVTAELNANTGAISPFQPSDADVPSLYLAFTLPANRITFSNRPFSLYASLAAAQYGDRTIPLTPQTSRLSGTPGAVVRHPFILTNPTNNPVQWTVAVRGQQATWQTVVTPQTVAVPANSTQALEVQVTVPLAAISGTHDRAILLLTPINQSTVSATAEIITIAGQNGGLDDRLQLEWQYWNGTTWAKLLAQDQSLNLTRSGLIEFLPPADFAPRSDWGLPDRYWLRVQWQRGAYVVEPRLRGLFLNTTLATQTQTLRNERLGSTDGSAGQTFRTTQTPVLAGQSLEVREPEKPSQPEWEKLGAQAITEVLDATGQPQEIWVRWQEVTDFYASQPRDRHYVLNHLTGEIRFGNGLNGLIPPVGTGNLRLTYQTGGGSAGNKPEGTIVQLKTTIPYIDKVTNPEPATGGADAESIDLMRDREPRKLRHNDRAVTLEDYEDLAMIASPAVARAKCVPLLNLLDQPTAIPSSLEEAPKSPGNVSVIIVPRSAEVQPLPSLELLNRVQDYLQAHSLATVEVAVVGPLYVQVSVTVEIALTSLEGATAVEQAVDQTLTSFLHPLTGGFDHHGWAFGREPYKSDFYRLIEAIPGVDYIRRLTIDDGRAQASPQMQQQITAILNTKRFLVYSGQHRITLFFDDDR